MASEEQEAMTTNGLKTILNGKFIHSDYLPNMSLSSDKGRSVHEQKQTKSYRNS